MSRHIPDASTVAVRWSKSSYSAGDTNCLEVADLGTVITVGPVWHKSRYSGAQADCVETAVLSGSDVAVRDSKVPAGPALLFRRTAIRAFVDGLKGGAFDPSS